MLFMMVSMAAEAVLGDDLNGTTTTMRRRAQRQSPVRSAGPEAQDGRLWRKLGMQQMRTMMTTFEGETNSKHLSAMATEA